MLQDRRVTQELQDPQDQQEDLVRLVLQDHQELRVRKDRQAMQEDRVYQDLAEPQDQWEVSDLPDLLEL